MNPLKYRLPEQRQNDCNALQPRPNALVAWISALPDINVQSTAPLALKILQAYNRCKMPAEVRLKAMLTLQPIIDNLIKQLRGSYQNEALPLPKNTRAQADLVDQFLNETTYAYKAVIADSVLDTQNNMMSINLFIAALRLTIDHLGQQLVECYRRFAPPVPGLWGELNRTYQLAERNGLHTRALVENGQTGNPYATVQHGYLRVALLALTMPNHLMPGQASLVYDYLEKWTVGCRILTNKVTTVETGDIVIDLASEHPPVVATGYARFRPIDGRFLDISKLQEKLDEISASVKSDHASPLTIAERLRRDLLTRLRSVWQGRAERSNQRESDMNNTFSLCIGLDACHHFLNGEEDFTPEQNEVQIHRRQVAGDGLGLMPIKNAWESAAPSRNSKLGTNHTRLSHFSTYQVDVWEARHDTEIHARSNCSSSRTNA